MADRWTAFGLAFASKIERDRYLELRAAEQAGAISELQAHPGPFTLVSAYRDAWGKRWSAVTYTGDFRYIDADGVIVIEEVKPDSRRAKSWGRDVPLRLKLLAQLWPEYRVRIWTPSGGLS